MSNYNSLKTTIDANIKQNGRQEITGQILNSVLNAMVTTLGTGYQFAGVATIDTNPGTPDAKVFYIANGKGTYEKFGGINVTEDDVVVLYWDTAWHKVSTGIASQAKLSELEGKINDLENTIIVPEKNLFNKDALVNGRYVDYSTGNYVSNSAFATSALIPIVGGENYTISCPNVSIQQFVFRDVNGNYISGDSAVPTAYIKTITAPSNAFYIEVTLKISSAQEDTYQIEKGETATPYQPYKEIYNIDLLPTDKQSRNFYVGVGKDYTRLTNAILEATKYNNSVVYVDEGKYDLLTEFKLLYGQSFFIDYSHTTTSIRGLVLKNNIHLILAPNAVVEFNYTGSNTEVMTYFSPFNSGEGGFTFEGGRIEATKCRYVFHDDRSSATDQYVNTYKNISMYLNNTENTAWGGKQCIGGGFSKNGRIYVESCSFESIGAAPANPLVSWHNTEIADAQSTLVISGCYFKQGTIRITWYGTSTKISRVMVSNNSLMGSIIFRAETSAYDIQNVELLAWNNEIRQ